MKSILLRFTLALIAPAALLLLFMQQPTAPVKAESPMAHSNPPNASQTDPSKGAFTFKPIGVIHSPYNQDNRPPRQGRLAPDVSATIELDEEYAEGLRGIEIHEYIMVLFVFDQSEGWRAEVTPPGADRSYGVFATRSPNRPCPIGLTTVKLVKREGNTLHIAGIDAFDGTPVLDIKPYISRIDAIITDKNVEEKMGLEE